MSFSLLNRIQNSIKPSRFQITGIACALESLLCCFNCGLNGREGKSPKLTPNDASQLRYDKMVPESSTHFTLQETATRAVTSEDIQMKTSSSSQRQTPHRPEREITTLHNENYTHPSASGARVRNGAHVQKPQHNNPGYQQPGGQRQQPIHSNSHAQISSHARQNQHSPDKPPDRSRHVSATNQNNQADHHHRQQKRDPNHPHDRGRSKNVEEQSKRTKESQQLPISSSTSKDAKPSTSTGSKGQRKEEHRPAPKKSKEVDPEQSQNKHLTTVTIEQGATAGKQRKDSSEQPDTSNKQQRSRHPSKQQTAKDNHNASASNRSAGKSNTTVQKQIPATASATTAASNRNKSENNSRIPPDYQTAKRSTLPPQPATLTSAEKVGVQEKPPRNTGAVPKKKLVKQQTQHQPVRSSNNNAKTVTESTNHMLDEIVTLPLDDLSSSLPQPQVAPQAYSNISQQEQPAIITLHPKPTNLSPGA